MTLLAIDCSTARGSVALAVSPHGPVLWQTEFTAGRGQGGKLFAALAEALQVCGESPERKLEEIIVGLGPGSYSGVRQAIAVATGLSAATGALLVGVPSPLALETDAPAYRAVGDARRGTFYYTAVEGSVCVSGPELLESRDALSKRLAEHPSWPLLLVECAIEDELFTRARAEAALPLAARLLASHVSERRQIPLEPLYLRPATVTLPKVRAHADP